MRHSAHEDLLHRLSAGARPIADLDVSAEPGVYAWFLAPGSSFGLVGNPRGGPVYVGKSSNLSQREIDTHFADGKTGFSTLRRSLGAILKDELALTARPRGVGTSKSNYTAYCFDDAGERRLSAWMIEHLRVGVQALELESLREHETRLIALACPPLNLTGWANPEAARIRELRKVCADEARLKRPA